MMQRATNRLGFSLIEVLMAIMILGIGVISVAALLPAGIAQQQRSNDDVMGPIVANSAMALIRTKLRPEDFGTFEEYSPTFSTIVESPRPTVWGDWTWLRPSVMFENDSSTPEDDPGALDIFSYRRSTSGGGNVATEFPGAYPNSVPDLYGIPWNLQRGVIPPLVRIQQRERYYPIGAERPQFVWDCVFRRFGGRIYVGIFVYRVISPGGEPRPYFVAPNPSNDLPPLPVWLDLLEEGPEAWRGRAWRFRPNQPRVDGTKDESYDPRRADHAWMLPGQWLLDQNNNIHRVAVGRRSVNEYWDVDLAEPPPQLPSLPIFWFDGNGSVTDIWYMPKVDSNGVQLEPVYVSVQAL